MKILHSAVVTVPMVGIFNQMEDERRAAGILNINWEAKLFSPADISFGGNIGSILSLFSQWKMFPSVFRKMTIWLIILIKYYLWLRSRKDVDIYVLRYSVHDPLQIFFTWITKKPVYFIHHTLEVPELSRSRSASAAIKSFIEKICGPISLSRAQGIIGVTREIVNYEINRAKISDGFRYVYPNGILYDRNCVQDLRKNRHEWLFVASRFYSWHGLDKLLGILSESTENIVLHIVGVVEDRDRIMAKNDPRVVLHGLLSSEDINRLAGRCSIGLSSFSLDRKGMREACTLKVREYLRMGLPVAAGHDDVFPSDFLYFRNVGNDIGSLFAFSNWAGNISREDVSMAARPYIDKTILLADLANAILDNNKNSTQRF